MIPLHERIRTSLILPQIIFVVTIGLIVFAAAIGMVLATTPPEVILKEGAGISDSIKATVIRGDG